ncbi:hypothetical protein R3P38DRAFT_2874899 [Favolaschia claudopus]|uniref:Uncharacterized protein n=1 Tax=Favolaschia claudopus TaxID=2862362 RepID=A0AAW0D2H7_9AGAR
MIIVLGQRLGRDQRLSRPFFHSTTMIPRLRLLHIPHRPLPFPRVHARSYSLPSLRRPWSSRIWYRADGTPRSKVRGLLTTSLIISVLWSYATTKRLQFISAFHSVVSALVRVQRVDTDAYASVDFTSYQSSLDYFHRLFNQEAQLISKDKADVHQKFFARLAALNDNSSPSHDPTKRDRAHAIVVEAAQQVHALLIEAKFEHSSEGRVTASAFQILAVVFGAARQLTTIVEDPNDKDERLELFLVDVHQPRSPSSEADTPEVVG